MEDLTEVLRRAGLESEFDVSAMETACTPESRDMIERTNAPDTRGERFASVIYSDPIDERVLPIAFVGNSHIPVIATVGERHGYAPMITGSYTRENLAARTASSGNNPEDTQNSLVSILRYVKHYGFRDKPTMGSRPFVYVGDSHFVAYALRMPTAEQLRSTGIDAVMVFAEDEYRGDVDLDKFAAGFVGKHQLAEVLRGYQQAGLSVTIRGLEASDYGKKDESLRSAIADTRTSRAFFGHGRTPGDLADKLRRLRAMRAMREQASRRDDQQ